MGLTWTGLAEFKAFLLTLPADIAADAVPIVTDAATLAHGEILNNYARHVARTAKRRKAAARARRARGPLLIGATRETYAAQPGLRKRTGRKRQSGALARGLKLQIFDGGTFGARAVVVNKAKHAALFEYGTQARHTDIGADRGSMPPGNFFIGISVKHRRAMYARIGALLERYGFSVMGTP